MVLSGSCLASRGGPQRQMACQGVVTEARWSSSPSASPPPLSLVQLGTFWPLFKPQTGPLLTCLRDIFGPETNTADTLQRLKQTRKHKKEGFFSSFYQRREQLAPANRRHTPNTALECNHSFSRSCQFTLFTLFTSNSLHSSVCLYEFFLH